MKTKKYKFLNKNRTIKGFKPLQCAPNQSDKVNKKLRLSSCYDDKILFQMKNIWNRYNKDKIRTNKPYNIWLFFKNRFGSTCNNELCWLKYKKFNAYLDIQDLKNNFRPKAPEKWKNNFYEWLSSLDIVAVMKQYEKEFKNFVFIGPSAIDFDDKKKFGLCVWEQLCKFNLKNYYTKNKKKIGIILNLDFHYNSGTHWVALFIDLDKDFIFYFDSNGDKISKRVQILIDRIVEQGHNIHKNLRVISNTGVVHQQKDGSCGMYTLVFIVNLLRELKEPEFFIKNKVTDEEVQKCRKLYYNFD